MRRLGLVLLLFVIALPAGGHAQDFVSVGTRAILVYTAYAEWYLPSHEVSVSVSGNPYLRFRDEGSVVINPRASIFVIDTKHNRTCDDAVEVTPTQWIVDPAMSTASLNLSSTKCGAVHVTWQATTAFPGHYQSAGTTSGSGGNWSSAGAGASHWTSRPANATGTIGSLQLDSSECIDTCYIGRYDYAGAGAGAARFVLGGMESFEAISAGFYSSGRWVSVEAIDAREVGGTSRDGFGPSDHRYGCIRISSKQKEELDQCGDIQITVDPLLRTASVSGTWSHIHFSLTFAAQGRPELEQEEDLRPEPPVAVVYGEGILSQESSVSGWVWGRGYGTVRPDEDAYGIVCRGLGVFAWYGDPDSWW